MPRAKQDQFPPPPGNQLLQATTAVSTAIKNGNKNLIIDRGVDGYRQLSTNDNDGLRQNFLGFFETLGEPYTL
jgi:hypothetical protein